MLHQFFWPLPYIHTHTLRLFQFLVLELTSFGPFYSNSSPKTKLEEEQYLCFLKTRELPIFISLKLELELRTYNKFHKN